MVGLRFVTPVSPMRVVVQHTIQLIPRLPEPTLVTEVLVEPNVPVPRGQPLFQFDRRPYEYKVRQLEAELAQAQQGVSRASGGPRGRHAAGRKHRSDLPTRTTQHDSPRILATHDAGSEEDAQRWNSQLAAGPGRLRSRPRPTRSARGLKYGAAGRWRERAAWLRARRSSTRPATTSRTRSMVAPEDGFITNLQVRPGMVAGDLRLGAIASFICRRGPLPAREPTTRRT